MPALSGTIALWLLYAACALGQSPPGVELSGQVVDTDTRAPLPYVSVGIRGTAIGTVADDDGRFRLLIPAARTADSVRFSLLGYAFSTRPVRALAAEAPLMVTLRSSGCALPEAVVRPVALKKRVMGNPAANSRSSIAYFEDNRLGNQFGQSIAIRRPSWLEQVSFHIGKCTYDSLFFRVNIFALDPATDLPGASLLPQPVYVRVRKGQIDDRLVVDLRRFNLLLTDEVVVALETIRDLGAGELHLSARMLGGPIYFREGAQGAWEQRHGFGLGIDATILEER